MSTRRRAITLWLARPKAQRTASDVIPFHRWLAQHRPTLLGSTTGMQAARLLFAVLGKHVGQTASEGSVEDASRGLAMFRLVVTTRRGLASGMPGSLPK